MLRLVAPQISRHLMMHAQRMESAICLVLRSQIGTRSLFNFPRWVVDSSIGFAGDVYRSEFFFPYFFAVISL